VLWTESVGGKGVVSCSFMAPLSCRMPTDARVRYIQIKAMA